MTIDARSVIVAGGWVALALGMLGEVNVQEGASPDAQAIAMPRVSVKLAGRGVETLPAAVVLGGARVAVTATGKTGAEFVVQLGYAGTVVRQTRLLLDEKGQGTCDLALPEVRVRTSCEMRITGRDITVNQSWVLLPAAGLSDVATLIRDKGLGVVDEQGCLQKVLEAEKLAFSNLSTRMLQDTFKGNMFLIRGFSDANMLNELCQRLEGRLQEGMSVVIVNPPEGWTRWGLSVQKPSHALNGAVILDKDYGNVLKSSDFGSGLWEPALEILEKREEKSPQTAVVSDNTSGDEKKWKALVWMEIIRKSPEGTEAKESHWLVSAKRFDKGLVVVALSSRMNSPVDDAIGRGLLDDLIHWVVKHSKET